MRLTPPSTITFVIGVLLLAIGLLIKIDILDSADLEPQLFWITFAGGAVLAAGSLFRGI